jgi:hypothetical protein
VSDWKPREHDHLIEPVFGGLGTTRSKPAAFPEGRSPALLAAALAVVLAIALRVAMLV